MTKPLLARGANGALAGAAEPVHPITALSPIPVPPAPMPLISATIDGKHCAQAEAFIQSAVEDERIRVLVRMAAGGEPEPESYVDVAETAMARFKRFDKVNLFYQIAVTAGGGCDRLRVTIESVG